MTLQELLDNQVSELRESIKLLSSVYAYLDSEKERQKLVRAGYLIDKQIIAAKSMSGKSNALKLATNLDSVNVGTTRVTDESLDVYKLLEDNSQLHKENMMLLKILTEKLPHIESSFDKVKSLVENNYR